MDRMSTRITQPGFTLIELMIVLVVLAAAVSIGAPSMRGLLQGNQLRSESSRFLEAINLARSEAVMRNQPVSICPSAMAVTGNAKCAGTYEDGWLVFANQDGDQAVDAGEDSVIRAFGGLPRGYRLTNRTGSKTASGLISYLPDGTSYGNATLLFCPPAPVATESISIVLNIVGRARVVLGRNQCPVA